MGNSRSDSEADYALYGRPKNGQLQEPVQVQDSVQITDDGGAAASGDTAASGEIDGSGSGRESGRAWESGGGDQPSGDGVRGPEAPGRSASEGPMGGPHRRGFNPYLCAAWVLVIAVLATGMAWLTGALEPDSYYSVDPSSGDGMDSSQGRIASYLYGMGPFLLLLGLIGAFTLLTMQAATYRRRL